MNENIQSFCHGFVVSEKNTKSEGILCFRNDAIGKLDKLIVFDNARIDENVSETKFKLCCGISYD